jgi:hypothetical protein
MAILINEGIGMIGRRSLVLLAGILAVALLGLTSPPAGSYALMADCELYGAVSVRGETAPVGARIEAFVDGLLLADTAVVAEGHYEILIPADDPITVDKDGWETDDLLTLTVNGESAQPKIVAFEGRKEVDLAVQHSSNVRRSTWGKIKALFR